MKLPQPENQKTQYVVSSENLPAAVSPAEYQRRAAAAVVQVVETLPSSNSASWLKRIWWALWQWRSR
jgi:hypothetical protein